jgi:hypothetical protein
LPACVGLHLPLLSICRSFRLSVCRYGI